MKNASFLCVSVITVFFLSSCKKAESTDCNLTTNLCSCDKTAAAEYPGCHDYEAMPATTAASNCKTDGGTFSTSSSCPTATRVGTCKYNLGTQVTYQRYYTASYATAASAAVVCAYYKANCFVLSGGMLCDGVWTADL